MNTLIVEDDITTQTLLARLLQHHSLNTFTTASLREAQAYFSNPPLSSHPQIDLLILDLQLSDGNGLDLLKTLQHTQTSADQIPPYILILTTSTTENEFNAAFALGANDWLSKPFDHSLLHHRIRIAKKHIALLSEKHSQHHTLLQNEARFRFLTENSREIIASHHPDGTIETISPSCQTLLGLAPNTFIGQTFKDILHTPTEPVQLDADQTQLNGSLSDYTTWKTVHPTHRAIRTLQTYTHAIPPVQNEPKRLYSYTRDLTEFSNSIQLLQTLLKFNTLIKNQTPTPNPFSFLKDSLSQHFNLTAHLFSNSQPPNDETTTYLFQHLSQTNPAQPRFFPRRAHLHLALDTSLYPTPQTIETLIYLPILNQFTFLAHSPNPLSFSMDSHTLLDHLKHSLLPLATFPADSPFNSPTTS